MDRMSENKIILVKRKTRLEELIARYNTTEQAKFFVERLGSDFSDYILEDQVYKRALRMANEQLSTVGRVQLVDREYVSNFIFGDQDIVVAVGQDGLVANTLKYLDTQLLIGVNPDSERWDGVLLPFKAADLKMVVQDVMKNRRQIKEVTMAKAILNDGQWIYAVNDLYIGQRTHVSSRYHLKLGNRQEFQSSSGIIVSTGLGSSGWLKSVLAGATGIAGTIIGSNIETCVMNQLKWDSGSLYFSVREPFPSKSSYAGLVFGEITENCPLRILSQMPENGVIFSDGIEADYLQFGSGVEAMITIADKKGHLVV